MICDSLVLAMDLPIQPQNFIEIKDESDDDQDVRLEDFMTAEELNAVLQGPLVGPVHQEPYENLVSPMTEGFPSPAMATYEQCLQEILEVFPDISHEHVKELYDGRQRGGVVASDIPMPEALISVILDGGKYPKERDRLNELKRKRLSELNSDDERAAEWKNADHTAGESFYSMQA